MVIPCEPTDYLRQLFSETLEFKFHSAGLYWMEAPAREPWTCRPTTYVGQIEHSDDTVWIAGAEPLRFKAGEGVILPPNLRLRHEWGGNASGKTRIRWSHFQFLVAHSVDIANFLELPHLLSRDMAERFGDFNEALVAADNGTPPLAAAVKMKRVAFEMLELMLERMPLKPRAMEALEGVRRFEPVLELIKRDYAKRLTVAGLAKRAGMSPSRFHAAFKAALGAPPLDYVIGRRVEDAQRLLGFTTEPIGEVAARCGYEDQLYFSKVFKARVGSTPSEYRAEVQASAGMGKAG